MEAGDKREVLNELNAFSGHVLDDVMEQSQQRAASPAADPSKAFGIWKPPGA